MTTTRTRTTPTPAPAPTPTPASASARMPASAPVAGAAAGRSALSSRPSVLLAAVVLLAVNLRLVFASASPLLHDIERGAHLSGSTAGLLTTAPVLCLGLGAPLAMPLARRSGNHRVLLGCLLAIAAGAALRSLPGTAWLFAGTVLAGAAIAIANVLLPSVVRQHYPDRIGRMTGIVTMLISGGSAIAAGLAAPVEHLLGGWRPALAVWALPALLAAVFWLPRVRPGNPTSAATASPTAATAQTVGAPSTSGAPGLVRSLGAKAWQITAFMGMQSLLAYALMAWLPQLLRDHGIGTSAAGGYLALLSLASIPSALLVPAFAARRASQSGIGLGVVALSALGLAGLLVSPTGGTALWALLLGLGQGGELGLALTLINLRSDSPAKVAALSGMAQSLGYLLAATGPVGLGLLHSACGDWTGPLLALLALLVPLSAAGMAAGRPTGRGPNN